MPVLNLFQIFLNTTLSTLQLYMQQLNNAIDETTSQVLLLFI